MTAAEQLAELRAMRDQRIQSALAELEERIAKGAATYADAQHFAGVLGGDVGQLLCDALLPMFPLDSKDKNEQVRSLISAMMRDNYNTVSGLSARIQKGLNRRAGIGLEAVTPAYNTSRAKGIVRETLFAKDFAQKRIAIEEQVENAARAVVDDTVKANAAFHWTSGLTPKVTRMAVGKCCEWCQNLAGTYSYPNDIPKELYRRHTNCNCLVLYDPGRGAKRDVHSKTIVTDPERRIREIEAAAAMRRVRAAQRRKELYDHMR